LKKLGAMKLTSLGEIKARSQEREISHNKMMKTQHPAIGTAIGTGTIFV